MTNNYRYVLRREWLGGDGILNCIMLNPSVANEFFDDPTVRRVVGFGKRWGYSATTITNMWPYRATNPNELRALLATDGGYQIAIGIGNDEHILREAKAARTILCAWGDNCEMFPRRSLEVIAMLRDYDLFCIRRTVKGNPAHPVREPYTDKPELFFSKLAA